MSQGKVEGGVGPCTPKQSRLHFVGEPKGAMVRSPWNVREKVKVYAFMGIRTPDVDSWKKVSRCRIDQLSIAQMDSLFNLNMLSQYAKASNTLTKVIGIQDLCRERMGDEFLQIPYCTQLCARVPVFVGLCGHASCESCQMLPTCCFICKTGPLTKRVNYDLEVQVAHEENDQEIKKVGNHDWQAVKAKLYTNTDKEALAIATGKVEDLNKNQIVGILAKNNIQEPAAYDDEDLARALLRGVIRMRIGTGCMGCDSANRVYILSCKHLWFCQDCILKAGGKCPYCSRKSPHTIPINNDTIDLVKRT
ncbi:uncharacterized protein LOC132195656 [Neocloeon triangulifer]|uniref:uncharacterized protein LOC132195656 n=1 Tax=Neocloeon triangulifer TaxID=2078957 RepID=UPI00286F4B54|nr:uncharacterized protein LOC132195656 [Neocloeon triangulifer]